MIASLLFAASVAAAPPDCPSLIASAWPYIEHANGDWVRAMKARDAAAIAAAYADDGVFVLADGTEVKGRAAVQALYEKASAAATASITGGGIAPDETACNSQGLIYEWGDAELDLKGPDGGEHARGGPYLTVWKQVGHEWKIVRNLAF
jgi:ketosteroid isomerase-like protein